MNIQFLKAGHARELVARNSVEAEEGRICKSLARVDSSTGKVARVQVNARVGAGATWAGV